MSTPTIYEYRCDNGHEFTRKHALFTFNHALLKCPTCKAPVHQTNEQIPAGASLLLNDLASLHNTYDRAVPTHPDPDPNPAPVCLMLGPWSPPCSPR